jgi:hypothetical protein
LLRLSALWWSLLLCAPCSLWPSLGDGLFTSLMWRMSFCMASRIQLIRILSVAWTSPCMVWSRLLAPGRFATYLLSLGFVEAKSDTSLFVYQCGSDTAFLLLYVDDIVLTASLVSLLRRIISALQQEFAMKDIGELHHFLGMHV